MFPCRPQMETMVSVMIFLEVHEWTWHYDLALNSLILLAHSSFRLYIFFQRPFSAPVVDRHFGLQYSFDDLPLYYTYSIHFPAHAPPASSMETEPSEESSPRTILLAIKTNSSSTGTQTILEMSHEENDVVPVLENGFHTPRSLLCILTWAYLCT